MAISQKRCDRLCQAAIGKTMRIQQGPSSYITGIIVSARFSKEVVRGNTSHAQFDIVMECGVSKTRQSFTVEKLPQ